MKIAVYKKGQDKPYQTIDKAIDFKENQHSYTIFTKQGKQIYAKPEHRCEVIKYV